MIPLAIPFPVEAPYQVKADLKRIEEDDFSTQWLWRDAQLTQYLNGKLASLANQALCPWLVKESAFETNVIDVLIARLAWVNPDLFVRINDTAWQFIYLGLQCDQAGNVHISRLLNTIEARCVQWLLFQKKAHRLWHCLALSLQEDFALMHKTEHGFIAEALHVCFPSGWSPQTKFTQDLSQIHEPVADGDRLRASTKPLSIAMVNKGPFVRYVWTLCSGDHLSEHPHLKAQRAAASPYQAGATVFFRCERQVTIPFAEHSRSLFLIRVFSANLEQVIDNKDRATTLIAAIESMTPASKQYKAIEAFIPQTLLVCQAALASGDSA